MLKKHAELIDAMIEYDRGDTARIQHFIKVHNLAATIGELEGLDENTLFILETAAILHDIGIRKSEEKYGSASGKYQEIEGSAEAEKLLLKTGGYSDEQIQRVKYLIAHHHTYNEINGIDYQILVEADFLVNLFELKEKYKAIMAVQKNIFRTTTGIKFLNNMFDKEYRYSGGK